MLTRIGTREQIGESAYLEMLRLRHKVFCGRLGWAIPNTSGDPELEEDEFDTPETVYIVLGSPVVACSRLIPAAGRSMISVLWPDVLIGGAKKNEWELSRFAADREFRQPGYLAAALLHAAYGHAVLNGIESYLVISTKPAARVIERMGVPIERIPSIDDSIVPSRTAIEPGVGKLLERLVTSLRPAEAFAA